MTINLVKSKFKKGYIILFLGMLSCAYGIIYWIIQLYDRYDKNGLKSTIIVGLFFGFLF